MRRHAMQAAFVSCAPGLFTAPMDVPKALLRWKNEVPAVAGGAALQVCASHAIIHSISLPRRTFVMGDIVERLLICIYI